jgi:3-ketosteroid 9alpha-monooxygenase subunit A
MSTSGRQKGKVRLAVDLPMGWFQVAWEGELEPGRAKPVTAFHDEWVLYRSEAGAFHMMEAYCGHMGAHLGHGGQVKGDCVVCPYHGWNWSAQGEVVDIPYSSRVNRSRRLATVPVKAVSGLVFAWYHPQGAAPLWEEPMPAIPEHGDQGYYPVWPHAVRVEEMHAHPQYVVENQVDSAHFVHVHNWADYVELDAYGADGHGFMSLARGYVNTKRGPVMQRVLINAWGVGIVISRHQFDLSEGPADEESKPSEVTSICTTPTTPGRSAMRMTSWLPRGAGDDDSEVPTGTAAALLHAGHREVFEHDGNIWDHMRYEQRPAYAREEARAFTDVREWTAQYYPEVSD